MTPVEPASNQRRALLSTLARVAFAVLGLGLFVATVADAGLDRIAQILPRAAPWLPLAMFLEGLRIFCEACATSMVLRERGRAISLGTFTLAQMVGHAVMNVFPAGRSASEVIKATLLAPWLGPQVAAAMGTLNQANVLVSSGLFSIACLIGALMLGGDRVLTWLIVVHVVVLCSSGIGLRVLTTNSHVERFLARRFPKVAQRVALFIEASRNVPLIAVDSIGMLMLGRLVQTLQYAVMAHAVGVSMSVAGAFAVQGANLVASMVGVLVPGQMGTSELVFRMSSDLLHTDPANALSIALLARGPQLAWVAIGFVVLFAWRGRRKAGTA